MGVYLLEKSLFLAVGEGFTPFAYVAEYLALIYSRFFRFTKTGMKPVFVNLCGGRGIRTLEELSPLTVFKTAAFNHSAIPPVDM